MISGQPSKPDVQSAQTDTTWHPIYQLNYYYIQQYIHKIIIQKITDMGTTPPPKSQHSQPQPDSAYCITYHSHPNLPDLLRIYKLFLEQPYKYINSIKLQQMQQHCCDRTVLKVQSPFYTSNLQTILNFKRKSKGFFVEKEIWYIVKALVCFFAFLQAEGIIFGVFNPRVFNLEKARFVAADILHLLPDNQHQKIISIHDYYSPEKLRQISNQYLFHQHHQTSLITHPSPKNTPPELNMFKSEVFSFGLLILQIATCPSPRPKFHKPSLKQLLWNQINNRYQVAQQRYSDRLAELLEMMLREDVRVRPDWSYLRYWIMRNEKNIDIAPCIFWSF